MSGCVKKKEVVQTPPPAPVAEPKFEPTADSSVTAKQVTLWKTCNPLLDSLTYFYSDSFKTEDPVQRLRYEEDFRRAQDKICKLAGFVGGYKEYTWVMESMGNARNRGILEAQGISY